LGDALGNVPVHCHGHQNVPQSRCIFHHCLLACRPGGRWGNTEQVVDQWQRPGASIVALDLLHWVKPCVLLQRVHMAIKMACDGGGTFFLLLSSFLFAVNVANGPCYGPFKLTQSYNINLIGVISLFVCYWPLLTTVDAILATIVTGGQA
jgi:hypothetical protein